jgi:hypothetical protein
MDDIGSLALPIGNTAFQIIFGLNRFAMFTALEKK